MIIGSQERYIYPDTLKAMCTILVKLIFLFWSVGNELIEDRLLKQRRCSRLMECLPWTKLNREN